MGCLSSKGTIGLQSDILAQHLADLRRLPAMVKSQSVIVFRLHGMSQDKIFRLGVSQVWSTQSGEKTELPLPLPPLSLLVVVVVVAAVVARANLKARVCAKRVCHPRQGPAKVAKTQPEMKSTMLIHG